VVASDFKLHEMLSSQQKFIAERTNAKKIEILGKAPAGNIQLILG